MASPMTPDQWQLLQYILGQGSPQWLAQLYGLTGMLDRPTAWGAPDQIVGAPDPLARNITDPTRFAQQDPGIYLQGNPLSGFVSKMPKSWFSSDPSMAGVERDREIRDKRILSGSLFTDPNLSALLRSGAGYN